MNVRLKLELPTISFAEGILLMEGLGLLVGEGFEGLDGPAGMEDVEGIDVFEIEIVEFR
jgi:hypothetical protein